MVGFQYLLLEKVTILVRVEVVTHNRYRFHLLFSMILKSNNYFQQDNKAFYAFFMSCKFHYNGDRDEYTPSTKLKQPFCGKNYRPIYLEYFGSLAYGAHACHVMHFHHFGASGLSS